jgi:hypothetical protein
MFIIQLLNVLFHSDKLSEALCFFEKYTTETHVSPLIGRLRNRLNSTSFQLYIFLVRRVKHHSQLVFALEMDNIVQVENGLSCIAIFGGSQALLF